MINIKKTNINLFVFNKLTIKCHDLTITIYS